MIFKILLSKIFRHSLVWNDIIVAENDSEETQIRLLLAEDDPRLLKSLIHIFEVNKYSVDGVNNGEDALNYARSGEYDGLVLDIMMPRA